MRNEIPTFLLRDYLELVDWSGRIVCEEQLLSGYKREEINSSLLPILERLSLDREERLRLLNL